MTVNKLPNTVLLAREIQQLWHKVTNGTGLSSTEALRLISSHENLRAFANGARHRMAQLTKENEDLLLMVRRNDHD